MNAETSFAKFRKYNRIAKSAWAIALPLALLLLMNRLNLTLHVLLVLACGTGFLMNILMMRHAACPHCGMSVMAKWWNYGRGKQIMKKQPIHCAHCGKEVETE